MTRTAYYSVVCAAVLAIAAIPLFAGGFTITLINYVGVYALVVLGIVLLTGVGGLTSFGQATFVGLAAYSTAWLTTAQGAGLSVLRFAGNSPALPSLIAERERVRDLPERVDAGNGRSQRRRKLRQFALRRHFQRSNRRAMSSLGVQLEDQGA